MKGLSNLPFRKLCGIISLSGGFIFFFIFNYFKIGLSYKVCGKRSKPEGVFTVDSRHFRIKYVPKRSQYIPKIFSIIITSYGDGKFLYVPSSVLQNELLYLRIIIFCDILIQVQWNPSKPTTLHTEEKFRFRGVFGLERL